MEPKDILDRPPSGNKKPEDGSLQKPWVRIVISLLGAGMTEEIIDIANGGPQTNGSSGLFFVIFVLIL